MDGHIRSSRDKLIGYPPNSKSKGGRKGINKNQQQPRSSVHAVLKSDLGNQLVPGNDRVHDPVPPMVAQSDGFVSPQLTQEQVTQLLTLLRQQSCSSTDHRLSGIRYCLHVTIYNDV
ncbi:OLC1v1012540C1 [Oldenlandia corymbosa var. corymbosa]|uniref:OLC1v1012540C1 n=1 Tax=Oldenlandia corymbosa var. corymbosa TaxID=529605 RepID=A0AAV1DW59_OLDCO|nr:OLC1v1012540C1 [Oldenlandia corymbosa var. corymbosa]